MLKVSEGNLIRICYILFKRKNKLPIYKIISFLVNKINNNV